jgi:hypothetical protein
MLYIGKLMVCMRYLSVANIAIFVHIWIGLYSNIAEAKKQKIFSHFKVERIQKKERKKLNRVIKFDYISIAFPFSLTLQTGSKITQG